MANNIFIDKEGFIINEYLGQQSMTDITAMVAEDEKLVRRLRQEHKPVKMLIDLTTVVTVPTAGRKMIADSVKKIGYNKIAIFGGGIFYKYLVGFAIKALQEEKIIRYFDTEKEARGWLKE